MPITDEDYFEKIKKIDVLADELETEITASMQTCLIRFGEIVQIQNAMIRRCMPCLMKFFSSGRRLVWKT